VLIDPPKIDKRGFEELLEKAKKLAPFYVPEWDIDSEDAGSALLGIFFHILQEVTSRFNQVPEKNFIAFLDMLGVKLVPAQPAKAPLAFQLANGAPNVLVPELTQTEAAATEEREALIFETEQNILATTASLEDVCSVVPTNDEIFQHSQYLNDGKSFELFVNRDQQEHALYLGHGDLFDITGQAKIQLTIYPFPDQLLEPQLVSWQYYGKKVQVIDGQESESLGWYNFQSFGRPGGIGREIFAVERRLGFKPGSAVQGESLDLTIFGAKFQRGMQVSFRDEHIRVNTLEYISDSKLKMNITVALGTPTGLKEVIFTDPNGNIMTSRTFQVIDSSAVRITSVNPKSAIQGEAIDVSIFGANLQQWMQVSFSDGGIEVKNVEYISNSELQVNIAVAFDAPPGARDIIIASPDGVEEARGEKLFQVIVDHSTINVTSIEPRSIVQGETIDVEIFGANFQEGAQVSFSKGDAEVDGGDIKVDNVTFVDDSKLLAKITAKNNASPGTRNVIVTNPGVTLLKNDNWEITPYKINEIETRWIRCLLGVNATISEYVPAGMYSFQVDSTLGIRNDDRLQIADWSTTNGDAKVEFVKVVNASDISGLLFSVALGFGKNLDNRKIPEDLRQEFEKNEIILPPDATVIVEESDSRWLITDGEGIQICTVKKEGDQLKIYASGPTIYTRERLKYAHDKGTQVKRVRDVSRDWQTLNDLRIDTIGISTSPKAETGIEADMLFSNDVPLDPSGDIYPFGKQPMLYDTFYIGSQEAFSKKGAKIELNMDIARIGMSVRRIQIIDENTALKLERGLLFGVSLDLNYQSELDESSIPTGLREDFESNGFPLSEDVTVSVREEGKTWLITDKSIKRVCAIKKEEQLNVYTEPVKTTETIEQLLEWESTQLETKLGIKRQAATNILKIAANVLEAEKRKLRELTLSWEYWNGNGWVVIEGLDDLRNRMIKAGRFTVSFDCPEDIAATLVVGQESYWIRVRIVSGDYGKIKFIEKETDTWVPDTSEIDPPVIKSLGINYSIVEAFDLQHCLIHNNLEFQDVTQKSKTRTELFQPFQPIADKYQTLYLGFDKQLVKGPISLFFSLEEQLYPDENRPRVQWYYYAEKKWVRLDVVDNTGNLTQSGTIELIGPSDFAQTSRFGKKRYWLKAVDVEDRFQLSRHPLVEQVSPNLPVQGGQIDITISGSNFQKKAEVTLSGAGINVTNVRFISDSQQLRATVTIADDAPLGARDVTITNPDGSEAIGEGLLSIQKAPTGQAEQDPTGQVDKVVPDRGFQGEIMVVAIEPISEGSYQEGVEVEFRGDGIEARVLKIICGRTLCVLIGIARDAQPGLRDVIITNPEGDPRGNEGAFRVDKATIPKPCPEESQEFALPFAPPGDVSPSPKVKGIYVNSTWALQGNTIRNEILGSSDGKQSQSFEFDQPPVLSETVQVNEMGSISEDEKESIVETEGKDAVSEVTDALGNTTGIWVQWQRVDDFFDSKPNSRHYIINRVSGEIQFGDGTQGMIPPIRSDNIRATYQSGGGKDGNVGASEIQTLKSSVASVDSVKNPDAAGGGSDTETIEKALERGPQLLRNRGRAVTFEDYEWLAREASPDIARVKCLPNFSNQGKSETGWVTVIIVPESSEEKPVPSPLLLRKVKDYLQDRCSNVVISAKRLQVVAPNYIKVSVTADIYPTSIDLAPIAENKAMKALKSFLHPLTGGTDGTGWEFGRMVCFSDFYSLLEGISEIDHLENVSMILEGDGQTMTFTSETSAEVSIPPYALIYSGEHELTPKLLTE
jgi:hypothetical protein